MGFQECKKQVGWCKVKLSVVTSLFCRCGRKDWDMIYLDEMNPISDDDFDEDFTATGLFQAIRKQDLAAVIMCVKAGNDVNITCRKTGMTYFHVVVCTANPLTEIRYVPIVHVLSNADADLNVKDFKGVSPLHLSISRQLLEIMATLLRCGAHYDSKAEEEVFPNLRGPCVYEILNRYKSFSPGYWDAIRDDKAFRVNVLVKSWCRINISKKGQTLIEYAKSQNASEKIVKQLIDNEATLEFAHATVAGDEEKMMHLLSHYPIDLSTTDFSHRENFFEPYSPLTLVGAAIRYGHKHVLPMLKDVDSVVRDRPPKRDKKATQSSTICVISWENQNTCHFCYFHAF